MLHSVRCHTVSNINMNANSLHLNASRSTSISGLRDGGRASGMTVHCSRRLKNGSSHHTRGRLMASLVAFREGSSRTPMKKTLSPPLTIRRRKTWRICGAEDDFEVEDAVDYEMDGTGEDDEDEGDLRDYETEYDMPMGDYTVQESETFMSTEGVEEEHVVDYKIDEDEFHKLSLYDCDFFIRKIPDQDDDVFDFREMYVTAPDTDIYAIPKVIGELPKKPLRCMKSNYEYVSVTEPPIDTPRAPLSKTEYQAMKVFLIKHYRNLREDHEDFILDFENIYVIDSTTKSITKADVKIEVRRGKYRDRSAETLIVRDDGTTFRLIPTEDVHTPDQVVQALEWERTKENMDNYLRGFRDYEKSKWF